MKHPLLLLLVALPWTPSEERLATEYRADGLWILEAETELQMETVEFEMLRNGEPVDVPFGGGESLESRAFAITARVLEVVEEEPTALELAFDDLEGETLTRFGERENSRTLETPLDGETLVLRSEEDAISIEDEDALPEEAREAATEWAGSLASLRLPTDALLPAEAVEVGESWDLEPEAVGRVLALNLGPLLYRRPAFDGEGRRGPGGGPGGGEGRGPGGGRGSALGILRQADWSKARVSLADLDDEHRGQACARFELQLVAEGELAEPERSGRGGFATGIEAPASPRRDSTFALELEGTLYFSLAERRPLELVVEGTLETERESLRERGDFSMETFQRREGRFHHRLSIDREEHPVASD